MGRRGLPDRWMKYNPIGEKIAGTPFIAFKVPLKEAIVRNLPQHERFTPQILMDSVPNIGLIIDLTNTDRYYDPKDFLGHGIRYEKIFCRGHEIPNQSVVDKFFSIIDKYLEDLQSSTGQGDEKLIGVHCTHGLNRTGYLICRYMIRRLGFSPEDAITAFEKARGYPMEREEYLKNLRNNEDCSVTDGDLRNHDAGQSSGSHQDSTFFRSSAEAGNFPALQNPCVPNHAWDIRTDAFRNFSQGATASNFQRFPSDVRNSDFRSLSRSTRAGSLSWPSRINRGDFNGFTNFSRNMRTAGHPYYWELGASVYPEERVTPGNCHVPRRFHKQDYEDSRVMRQRRFDYPARTPSFSPDSRHSSTWRNNRTTDFRRYDHSI